MRVYGRWGGIEGVGGVSIPVVSLGLAMYQRSSHMCLTSHTSQPYVHEQLHTHLTLLMPVISPPVSVLAYIYIRVHRVINNDVRYT